MRMEQNEDIFRSLRSGAAGPEMKMCSDKNRTGNENSEIFSEQIAFLVVFLAHLLLKY